MPDAGGAIMPDIRQEAHDDLGPDCVCAWIQSPGIGSGRPARAADPASGTPVPVGAC